MGNSTTIGETHTDKAGVLLFTIDAANWPSGQYQLGAYGPYSKQTATAILAQP